MKKKCFCRPFLFFLFTSFVLGGCGQSKNNGMEEPGGLGYHAMAYDSESDKIVLYGGYLSTATWIYDLNTDSWRKIEGGLSPENRMFPAMTYDETVDRVILFGGGTGAQAPHFGTVYSDTWSFDCNTGVWEKLTPPRNPGKRVYGALVFCGKRGISVLFGGWSYDVNYPADGTLWCFDYRHQAWFT